MQLTGNDLFINIHTHQPSPIAKEFAINNILAKLGEIDDIQQNLFYSTGLHPWNIDSDSESYNCKLARMLRKRLHRLNVYTGFKVVFSPEDVKGGIIVKESDYKKNKCWYHLVHAPYLRLLLHFSDYTRINI